MYEHFKQYIVLFKWNVIIDSQMGILEASDTSDLLDPASWRKLPGPVFATSEKHEQYGPGHNSFTQMHDGKADILIYHARPYKEIIGNSLLDPNRHARAQRFTWKGDGTPDFGVLGQS